MTGSSVSFSDKPTLLSDLRRRIAQIERAGGGVKAVGESGTVSLGVADIDGALPGGGLSRGRLHEVAAMGARGDARGGARADGDVAALGFAAALLGRAANAGGTSAGGAVLWCGNRKSLYHAGGLHGPGLAAFGVDARRVILIDGADDTEVLWAMEEGLRAGALGAVAGEVGNLSLTASRRLQLAAEAGGGFGLLVRVRTNKTAKTVTAATTRWEVGPSGARTENGLLARRRTRGCAAPQTRGARQTLEEWGRARWDVVLARCRGGTERRWLVEWNHETHCFAVVAPVAGRPAVPGPGAGAGTGADPGTDVGRVVDLSRRAAG